MPDYRKLFPSDYIKAFDLEGFAEITVTIATIQTEDLEVPVPAEARKKGEPEKETLPTLTFVKAHKRLILNRTNADTIAALYGNNTDHWPGKRITLFVQPGVKAFGKVWEAIRIRPMVPPDRNGTQHDNTIPLQDEITRGMDQEEFPPTAPPPPDSEHLDRDIADLYGEDQATEKESSDDPACDRATLLAECEGMENSLSLTPRRRQELRLHHARAQKLDQAPDEGLQRYHDWLRGQLPTDQAPLLQDQDAGQLIAQSHGL